jgi:hypothetical protein
MKTEQAIQVLREYNLWRRADEDMDQPDPREIGRAIDTAIEAMEELSEWKTLTSWGGTPEIINDFIKGQQSRIYAAQEAEQQRDRMQHEREFFQSAFIEQGDVLSKVIEQRDMLAEALDRLERTAGLAALQDDPARVQARQALASVKGGKP